MNIASLQTLVSGPQQATGNGKQIATNQSRMAFGSVLNSITQSGAPKLAPIQESNSSETSYAMIFAVFNATTVEELTEALKSDANDSGIADFASLSDSEREQLIASLAVLLEKAGIEKSNVAALSYTIDFWSVLNVLENGAPQFFNQLTDALQGKGAIPKDQAMDLLLLFKTDALTAPKMDLLMKQEQQIFALQNFLGAAGEQFEKGLQHSTSTNRVSIFQMLETQHVVRFVDQANSSQQTADDRATKEDGLEASRNAVSNALGVNPTTRSELSANELETRNNARNETLMREMQTIFKRSNFGQTGGTNRLLIKLYPEHLGQVRIELLQTNGIMTARILASTALGKEMLDSQLNQLRNAFLQQNLQVERIDVSQTLQDTSRSDRGQQSFDQQFRREQDESNEQQEQNPEDQMTFQEYMIELEV